MSIFPQVTNHQMAQVYSLLSDPQVQWYRNGLELCAWHHDVLLQYDEGMLCSVFRVAFLPKNRGNTYTYQWYTLSLLNPWHFGERRSKHRALQNVYSGAVGRSKAA